MAHSSDWHQGFREGVKKGAMKARVNFNLVHNLMYGRLMERLKMRVVSRALFTLGHRDQVNPVLDQVAQGEHILLVADEGEEIEAVLVPYSWYKEKCDADEQAR